MKPETNQSVTSAELREFIERQRRELREMSARCDETQREALRSHVEFYTDELAK